MQKELHKPRYLTLQKPNITLANHIFRKAGILFSKNDPSHDVNHAQRVLALCLHIARGEKKKVDLQVLIPAAILHDIIVYPKNGPKAHLSTEHSAEVAEKILLELKGYPKEKIANVKTAITQCSFSKGVVPRLYEAKILQDADRLEATGAISIMRTFSSTGSMKRTFYNTEDPFCEKREPDPVNYALDLFYARLLKVGKMMHTKTAKKIAARRTKFLYKFLNELKMEFEGK
ncbi:MAG: HD domain-containing protein [Candidatus Micrarchaeia archaeon]